MRNNIVWISLFLVDKDLLELLADGKNIYRMHIIWTTVRDDQKLKKKTLKKNKRNTKIL